MKLDFSKIKEITVGAVDIWQEDGAVCFSKCTKKQIARWGVLRDDLFVNANATTGIKLDFSTNSSFVECVVFNALQFEVKVNGILKDAYFFEDTTDHIIRVELDLSHGENRVEIVFNSHHYAARVRSVEIQDGCFANRTQFKRKMLFAGDSITQGWRSKYNSISYGALVSDFFNAEAVIQGIGGGFFDADTIDHGGFEPDYIFVAFGTNDYTGGTDFSVVEKRMIAYFDRLKETYKTDKVFYISPIWRTDTHIERPMGGFYECSELMKQTAKKCGAIIVDGEKMLAQREEFLADPVHPNDLGFYCYAFNLVREIKNYIL